MKLTVPPVHAFFFPTHVDILSILAAKQKVLGLLVNPYYPTTMSENREIVVYTCILQSNNPVQTEAHVKFSKWFCVVWTSLQCMCMVLLFGNVKRRREKNYLHIVKLQKNHFNFKK
jgi:hypothetical protein